MYSSLLLIIELYHFGRGLPIKFTIIIFILHIVRANMTLSMFSFISLQWKWKVGQCWVYRRISSHDVPWCRVRLTASLSVLHLGLFSHHLICSWSLLLISCLLAHLCYLDISENYYSTFASIAKKTSCELMR